MQSERHFDNAVLLYFLLLIIFVIFNMFSDMTMVDVIYFVALLCAILKYLIVISRSRR